jgi:small subunit ribosomal protein S1
LEETTVRSPADEATSPEAGSPESPQPSPAPAPTPGPKSTHERPTAGPTRKEKENMEDFATALETFTAETEALAENRTLKGTVLKITATHVVVDIGSKSEGLVPIAELQDENGNVKVSPGDEIGVMVQHGEREEGYVVVSHQKAQRLLVWDDIETAYNQKKPMRGRVVERVKGGLSVDIGVRAFLPGSQVDVRPVRNLDAFKGQELEVRVVKLNKKRGNVVVSRKQLLEEEQTDKRSKTLEQLHEGAVLTGAVKNLTDYGAFVDLGGIDGLLHITDMSWGRLTHPRDLVNVGDEIHVKVLKYDMEKQRVSLGFKQLTPDPWLDAAQRYPVRARVKGRVISVTDYGAFIELEQGIEGLVHVSEMTWSKRTKHPSKLVNVGDQVECVVLNVNPTERRISLGLKQLEANPWETLHERYPNGAVVEGRVRNLTDFGAFVEIEDGIDGLVHVSNMSWTKRVKHPSEVLKKGERVKAVVLGIDPDQRRLSLGLKQLQPDIWETFFSSHRIGDVLPGKVLRVASFGAFVELADGVEGLCHNSEAIDEHGGSLKLQPGGEHNFKIIKMNPEEKKVGLSLRAVGAEASRQEVESYKHPASSATSTIEELMSWKRAGGDER